jgi:hypothetical protein
VVYVLLPDWFTFVQNKKNTGGQTTSGFIVNQSLLINYLPIFTKKFTKRDKPVAMCEHIAGKPDNKPVRK